MMGLSNGRNAKASLLIGALVALGLSVVVPIHLNNQFLPACSTMHTGLHAAHHTVVDRIDARLEAQIDRASRVAAPEKVAAAAVFASAASSVLLPATAVPPRVRRLRRLRIARSRTDNGDPSSYTVSLRV
jgi:hypothetical protein